MAVFELKTEVLLDTAPALEDLLAEREEQRLMVLEDKPSGRAWLMGYFGSRAEAAAAWKDLAGALDAAWTKTEPVVRELPDEDWKNSYKAHFKAWKFDRLNWVPVWERETFVLPAGEEVLWLDPGMAFGTGNHETTRLCCERLTRFAAARGSSGRVIDVGCGSGILALSAAKLGFREIAAFDNDPEAIRVSEENAALNELAGRVEFYCGDLVSGLAGRAAELVLANIQADVLMRFVQELSAAVVPGGQLVLSGILGQELETVRAKFAGVAAGWRVESRVLGEWADLALTRPS
ncbi:50S ribosomal protein L11 methyltransferase [Opitutus sp. GAS368]|jgi:ribosomal protein L11 methyltransferase|uniref:50S ribosomal protein L11 methyltransferase n=1 Tax=Opitutus sp. GAS368 TaxID=1882749 RepID=UPI00087BFCA3|nr:50S ribosomal protein L11 methyltransferase [Opitutus sp. GAS368]SDS29649.1 ribosomal protein L11 methyltransferase [Opitutus sp. GAS368]